MPVNAIINETISSNTTTGPIKVRRGGAHVIEFIRTAGSIDLEVQISFDGSTYVTLTDTSGTDVSSTLDGTTDYKRWELLAQVDSYYQIVSTNNSSGSVDAKMTRIISE